MKSQKEMKSNKIFIAFVILFSLVLLVVCSIGAGKKLIHWMEIQPEFSMEVSYGENTEQTAQKLWIQADENINQYVENVFLYVYEIPYDYEKSEKIKSGETLREVSFFSEFSDMIQTVSHSENVMEAVYIRANQEQDLRTPDEVIAAQKAICWEKADLFCALMACENIPCKVYLGYPKEDKDDGHAWNEIYINGKYEYFDATNGLDDKAVIDDLFVTTYVYHFR